MSKNENNDLLIVGAGRLGRHLSEIWLKQYPPSKIYGETRGKMSHSILSSEYNIKPYLLNETPHPLPKNIVYCVPVPPGSPESYIGDVQQAVIRAKENDSNIIFTSSGSVHGSGYVHCKEDTHTCDVNTSSEPRGRLLSISEKEILSYSKGIVVRCSGLYQNSSPPHESTIKRNVEVVPFPGDSPVNMIHYQDAASCILKIFMNFADLQTLHNQNIFIAAAGTAVTIERLWEMGLSHPKYLDEINQSNQYTSKKKMPAFLNNANRPGWKSYDSTLTRQLLNWTPEFDSYEEFYAFDKSQYLKKQQQQS